MGSVSSLLERQDFSLKSYGRHSQGPSGLRQPDGSSRKGLGQRELLSYLHLPKKGWQDHQAGPSGMSLPTTPPSTTGNTSGLVTCKTPLPERGRFDKVCLALPLPYQCGAGMGRGVLSEDPEGWDRTWKSFCGLAW